MLAIWFLIPLPFLNPAWTSGSSWFTHCWSLTRRILSIILLACEMSAIAQQFEHSLVLPFFGIGMKTDLFQEPEAEEIKLMFSGYKYFLHGSDWKDSLILLREDADISLHETKLKQIEKLRWLVYWKPIVWKRASTYVVDDTHVYFQVYYSLLLGIQRIILLLPFKWDRATWLL